jgi:hypothetical protein
MYHFGTTYVPLWYHFGTTYVPLMYQLKPTYVPLVYQLKPTLVPIATHFGTFSFNHKENPLEFSCWIPKKFFHVGYQIVFNQNIFHVEYQKSFFMLAIK